MITIPLSEKLCRDAGNRSMKANGRLEWNEDDYDAATAELWRLLHLMDPEKYPSPEPWRA